MTTRDDNHGRPLEDRQALACEELYELMPKLQLDYDLRDDQLAEVLDDLHCWYADVEICEIAAQVHRNGSQRKGGAA